MRSRENVEDKWDEVEYVLCTFSVRLHVGRVDYSIVNDHLGWRGVAVE